MSDNQSSNNRLFYKRLICLCLLVHQPVDFALAQTTEVQNGAPSASESVDPVQWLLRQIREAETNNRDDLVKQSLHRLVLIAPDNPETLAAQLRFAVRQGDNEQAKALLARLAQRAPDSKVYRDAQLTLTLNSAQARQQLQQIELLAVAGRVTEAKAQYDALFAGAEPPSNLALAYWSLVARIPQQRGEAIRQLQNLDHLAPGNSELRLTLARLLFAEKQDEQAYSLLTSLAGQARAQEAAAELWLKHAQDLDDGANKMASLQRLLDQFTVGDAIVTAQEELTRQKARLLVVQQAENQRLYQVPNGTQPANQNGNISAKEITINSAPASGSPKVAIATPVSAPMSEADRLGEKGLALMRSGDRQGALTLFQQAQKADTSGNNGDKWQSLIRTSRYWMLIGEGNQSLKSGDLSQAQQKFLQAKQVDPQDSYAWLGLGDVAVAQKEDSVAESNYLQAQKRDAGNGEAIRGLTRLYQRQSAERALSYLDGLSPSHQAQLKKLLQTLRADVYQQQGSILNEQKQYAAAEEKYQAAYTLEPDDTWLVYRYAMLLQKNGKGSQADTIFGRLIHQKNPSPEQIYAYSLYLSAQDRDQQALAALHSLPSVAWSENMRELSQRLGTQSVLNDAQKKRDQGDQAGADLLLQQLKSSTPAEMLSADWALADKNYPLALARYQQVLTRESRNLDARIGLAEAYTATKQTQAAQDVLSQADSAHGEMNQIRRIAALWRQNGQPQRALALLDQIQAQAAAQNPSELSAMVWRETAVTQQTLNQPEKATASYRQAMVTSGITSSIPQDNDKYTALMRSSELDDWLKRGIKADAATLYHQQDITVALDHQYIRSSGTSGISDLRGNNTQLQIEMPAADGRAFFRVDQVMLNAGSFTEDTTLKGYHADFGSCIDLVCQSGYDQKATGTSLAIGWTNPIWNVDIGTTPLGFAVTDWVGGLGYRMSSGNIGWTFTASRRPLSSSLLAFAGTTDPGTGKVWGGVIATGGAISLSYDQGGANGVWSDLSYHQLKGRNVDDNQRVRFMGGVYHKLINQNDERLSVGLNTLLMHYQKDLSGYTLGQGGYYSPQAYTSFSVPVTYRRRTDNWSFEAAGSVSWSASSTGDQHRYPLYGLSSISDVVSAGSRSQGWGYTLQSTIERRLSSHWRVGLGINIQQAKDYTPSTGMIYVRYSADGWLGDMDLPPQPLTPYADFK